MTDAQLIKLARSFRYGMIGRQSGDYHCFMVCAPLAPMLRMNGVPAELCDGWIALDSIGRINHYWIGLKDGRVLDPTAEQFNKWFDLGLPRVYLGNPLEIHPALPAGQRSDG